MMVRTGTLALAALLAASVAGCEKTGEKEQKAEGVANTQAQESQYEADRKAAAAQAEADQKIAAARASFEKTREDYRHDKQSDLDSLNQKISDLEAREKTATGKAKISLDSRLPALRAQRDAFVEDLRSAMLATPATWDDTKARIDREWDALDKSVKNTP